VYTVLKVELRLKPGQGDVLRETERQFLECYELVYDWGLRKRVYDFNGLHAGTYGKMREVFPDLPSALVVQARIAASRDLKKTERDREEIRKIPPLVRYVRDAARIVWEDEYATLVGINGRNRVGLDLGKAFTPPHSNWRYADLLCRDDEYSLLVKF
jgi:hypothetical protein